MRTVSVDYPEELPLNDHRLHTHLRCSRTLDGRIVPVAGPPDTSITRADGCVRVTLRCDPDDAAFDDLVRHAVGVQAEACRPKVRQAATPAPPRHIDPYEAAVREAWPPALFAALLARQTNFPNEQELALLDLLVRILLKR